jgi:hypothetical protein
MNHNRRLITIPINCHRQTRWENDEANRFLCEDFTWSKVSDGTQNANIPIYSTKTAFRTPDKDLRISLVYYGKVK